MMNTKIRQPPPQLRSPIIGLDNLLSRPGFANQTFDYMSTDRQYGLPDPKTGSFTLATLHGPGHVDSCEELGPEWHYHSSKPENQPVYTYNSVGHRNDFDLKDLPDREFGIAFGCSQTEGIGLKHENVFHQIISKRLQIPFYNCGIAGAANDVTYWNFTQIMRRYKPAVVLYQLTASTRFLVNTNNKLTFSWGFPNPNVKPGQADDGFDFTILANKLKYDTLRTQMQIESVKTVCKLTNTKLVFFDAFRQFVAPNSSRDEFPNGEELIFSFEEEFGWVDWSGINTPYNHHISRAWAARDRWHMGIEDAERVAERAMPFLNDEAARDRWHMGIEDSNRVAERAMPFLNNGQPFANGA